MVIAIDEETFKQRGGVEAMRAILSEAFDKLAEAQPKVVAIDVILTDARGIRRTTSVSEASLRATRNLVLPCRIVKNAWEDPIPRFKVLATALGHVEREEVPQDGVTRLVPIEETVPGDRRWALALEAFRLARGQPIIESPDDLEVGRHRDSGATPRAGTPSSDPLPAGGNIPEVSVLDIEKRRGNIRGKTAFLGVTDLSAAQDRVINPFGE